MKETNQHQAFQILREKAVSRTDAAIKLSRFILEYLDYLLRSEKPCAFLMLIREVFSGLRDNPELFDLLIRSYVDKFWRSTKSEISALLQMINPKLSEEELVYFVVSIVSQCSFYASHRPFIEVFDDVRLDDRMVLESIAKHIAFFSFAALGVNRSECDEIFTQAQAGYHQRLLNVCQ